MEGTRETVARQEPAELTLSISRAQIEKAFEQQSFIRSSKGFAAHFYQHGQAVGIRLGLNLRENPEFAELGLQNQDVVLDIGREPTVVWREKGRLLFLHLLLELVEQAKKSDTVRIHLLRYPSPTAPGERSKSG